MKYLSHILLHLYKYSVYLFFYYTGRFIKNQQKYAKLIQLFIYYMCKISKNRFIYTYTISNRLTILSKLQHLTDHQITHPP